MDKPFACFEISSKSVKLIVGYVKDNKPDVLYSHTESIEGCISDGRIIDRSTLISVLKTFKVIDDKEKKMKLTISEANLVLPSLGLMVYQNDKFTNVVSQDDVITITDIGNAVSLINKEQVPNGNEIVDIIPDQFVLADGKLFKTPPVGEKSSSLTIKAKVHAIPAGIISSYKSVMFDAGFRIKKCAVSAYCHSQLYALYKDLPQTYLLLDIGGKISTLTFVGDSNTYSSTFFHKGGDDLTEDIATTFNCDNLTAKSIKEDYGYNPTKHSFNPPLYEGLDPVGVKVSFNQTQLNQIILDNFQDYMTFLKNSIKSLTQVYGPKFESLPILLTGGGSRLIGLKDLLSEALLNREIILTHNKSVGATSPTFSALLGLFVVSSNYLGSLADNSHGVRSVSRMDPQNNKKETPIEDEI